MLESGTMLSWITGNHLKKSLKNINAASKHYSKQSKFRGSKREVRGFIIKCLTQENHIPLKKIEQAVQDQLAHNKNDILPIIERLSKESVIKVKDDILFI